MYILFEMENARGDYSIYNFDLMGYTDSEEKAMSWVAMNPQYRTYKYCPNRKI